jgi:hypothetical protein
VIELLILIALVSAVFWIAVGTDSKNPNNSVHANSFYWPDKTETEKHVERISYQTNANYVNGLIKQIKGDKNGNQ